MYVAGTAFLAYRNVGSSSYPSFLLSLDCIRHDRAGITKISWRGTIRINNSPTSAYGLRERIPTEAIFIVLIRVNERRLTCQLG